MIKISLTQGKESLIDDSDFETVSKIKWHAMRAPSNKFYAKHRTIGFLHHFLVGKKDGMEVDHIDGNSLNNQRSNLRFVTHQENMFNRRKHVNNKTGFIGVYFTDNSWEAQIRFNGKKVFRKRFKTLVQAVAAREKEYLNYIK